MEAEFLTNFTCCNENLGTMHDLLRHYETVHTGSHSQANRPGVHLNHRPSISKPSIPTQSISGRQDAQAFQSPGQFGLGQQNRAVGGNANGGMGFGGIQASRTQFGVENQTQKRSHLINIPAYDELDAVADMEMEDAVGTMELDDNSSGQRNMQQTRRIFGQQQRPQLQLNMNDMGMQQQALRSSQTSTPGSAGFGRQNNPTVSSVNTPTLTTRQPLSGQMTGADEIDEELSGLGNSMNLGDFMQFSTDSAHFIDDPAKRLYSPNNASAQQRLQQQMAQYGLDRNQFPEITDPQHLAVLQRVMGTVPQPEEDKPFRCPVIGCEKAYKNQNGLK
jgi:transcription factor SFP1